MHLLLTNGQKKEFNIRNSLSGVIATAVTFGASDMIALGRMSGLERERFFNNVNSKIVYKQDYQLEPMPNTDPISNLRAIYDSPTEMAIYRLRTLRKCRSEVIKPDIYSRILVVPGVTGKFKFNTEVDTQVNEDRIIKQIDQALLNITSHAIPINFDLVES